MEKMVGEGVPPGPVRLEAWNPLGPCTMSYSTSSPCSAISGVTGSASRDAHLGKRPESPFACDGRIMAKDLLPPELLNAPSIKHESESFLWCESKPEEGRRSQISADTAVLVTYG